MDNKTQFSLINDDLSGKVFSHKVVLGVLESTSPKKYLIQCSGCAEDAALFGNGTFVTTRESIRKNGGNCGCVLQYVYTESQQLLRLERLLESKPYKFIGWLEGKYSKGVNTKCIMECPAHGLWDTTTLTRILNKDPDCPECTRLAFMKANIKSDSEMVQSFFDSGVFHPDTKFYRSDTLTKKGYKEYWHVLCPVCNEHAEARSYHLQAGKHPCACSTHCQKQAYINIIMDGDIPVALKFGIAKNSANRALKQNKMSSFDLEVYGVWEFCDVKSCKAAERELKSKLVCGILSKAEFPDGYSETTHTYNLDIIANTYKSFGGSMVSKTSDMRGGVYV